MRKTFPLPKELLLISGKPLIFHTIREAILSGISEIIIIINPQKNVVKDYLLNNLDLHNLKLYFLYQNSPSGLASAIALAEPYIKKEYFAVMLPDNIFLSNVSPMKQIINYSEKSDKNLVGVVEIKKGEEKGLSSSGIIEYEIGEKGFFKLKEIKEKERDSFINPGEKKIIYKICGRYIFKSDFFKYYEEMKHLYSHQEFDDLPILRKMIKDDTLMGVLIEGRYFDAGNPEGYLVAKSFF
ncbi:hypothetical protein DRQ09_04095 [candidate division KSB1 bacterium]|nr:MAG: hypothetical protein DRQ09_04095 [candidate division KSB1 bacterium]